ncbi:N-acetylmuramoyl-L-alanine amidase [Lentilactobacillus senioris]|uniref:N-acetylmuramoyl-L-alanine amidase n=1 Tax=Lentilactobacillus senioris TaxID=931534 RepID=UPI002281E6A4|nr:N-acetylmuramoyl-L-alanine amidase [Lentilactobacillus senioris]MCY9807440.1 N-acetylmuramoyl-L-alanine amidase [Lentilactobacillus senioris]
MAGEKFSKLITSVNPKIMNSSSRNGIKIDRIVIHHNASTNKNVAMNTWVAGGPANTSAHYEVTPTEIIGCVGEQYAAWHCGGTGGYDVPKMANPNQRSIGIENLNSTGAPHWNIADGTYENLAKLVADICKRYGIPLDRKHVLGHNEVTATACPGGIDVDKVVKMAKGQITTKPKKAEYFNWTPYRIYAKKQVAAYAKASQVGSGKNVKKIYKSKAVMEVVKLEGHRFKLIDGTYVTANKDYVNNLYYLPKSKIKQVRSVAAKGSGRYDDIKFNHKNAHFPKGTYFDVVKIVPYGKASRFLLANGDYISANKLVNKMVK